MLAAVGQKGVLSLLLEIGGETKGSKDFKVFRGIKVIRVFNV